MTLCLKHIKYIYNVKYSYQKALSNTCTVLRSHQFLGRVEVEEKTTQQNWVNMLKKEQGTKAEGLISAFNNPL